MRGSQHGYIHWSYVHVILYIGAKYACKLCQLFVCVQVSYLATDSLFPEWKIWTQFLDESTEGLRLDGLAESHPIEVTVHGLCFCLSMIYFKELVLVIL